MAPLKNYIVDLRNVKSLFFFNLANFKTFKIFKAWLF